jgi:KDO2-lipid IV(A) lauroyltransferase
VKRRRSEALDRPIVRVQHAAEYVLGRIAIAPLSLLPPEARIRFGGWVGRRVLLNLPLARRRVLRNLARVRPDLSPGAVRDLLAAVGDNFGRVIAEYQWMRWVSSVPSRGRLSGPGLDVLDAARAQGRGALIVSAHFGNWEAIRFGLRHRGIDCAIIYRDFNNPWFDAYVRTRMVHAGAPVLPKGLEGLKGFVAHIAKGGAGLILVDQKQTGAPRLPFLGHPAETATVAADLARRAKVPLIPAFARRAADGLTFDVEFEAPVEGQDPVARMTEINARIGARVEADPGQWFWLHNRWR